MIYLEHKSGYKLEHEEKLVAETLFKRGRNYAIASCSHVERKRIDITNATLAVGSMDFIKAALRQSGISLPVIESYPSAITPWLCRRVWQSSLRDVLSQFEIEQKAVFIKPAHRAKRFTGFVLHDHMDFRLAGVSRSEALYCSEPVRWLTEYRAYVVRNEIRHISHYDGDESQQPDASVVQAAVSALANSSHFTPASYAIDFGVLSSGQTACIEVNDGFALGAYEGLDGAIYTDLLQDRWQQITGLPTR